MGKQLHAVPPWATRWRCEMFLQLKVHLLPVQSLFLFLYLFYPIHSLFTFQMISHFLNSPLHESPISPLPSSCSPINPFLLPCPGIPLHCCIEPLQDQGPLLPSSWTSFDMWIVSWVFRASGLISAYHECIPCMFFCDWVTSVRMTFSSSSHLPKNFMNSLFLLTE